MAHFLSQDWPKHKEICKPGRQGKPPKLPLDKQQTDAFVKGLEQAAGTSNGGITQAELGGEWLGRGYDHDLPVGPERVIEVPVPGLETSERLRFVSRTLAPTELRKLREEMSKAMASPVRT